MKNNYVIIVKDTDNNKVKIDNCIKTAITAYYLNSVTIKNKLYMTFELSKRIMLALTKQNVKFKLMRLNVKILRLMLDEDFKRKFYTS